MVIINNAFIDKTAVEPKGYPTNGLPEICFVGKSNVGKSSLINCMVNKKSLARTSSTPGKTRTINFFNIEEQLYFVDLPGYGYAKISKSEYAKWGKMIEDYLINRQELKLIVLLIDIRHEPSKNDLLMFDWLRHYNRNLVVVATKQDKIKRSQYLKHVSIIKKALDYKDVMTFSIEDMNTRENLWNRIQESTGVEMQQGMI